jgi:hypothetical protein
MTDIEHIGLSVLYSLSRRRFCEGGSYPNHASARRQRSHSPPPAAQFEDENETAEHTPTSNRAHGLLKRGP